MSEEYFAGVVKSLESPFPEDAYVVDNSRGFALAGLRNAYVVERLNKAFGLLGFGWRYVVGPHSLETVKKKQGSAEQILIEIALQYRVGGPGSGSSPIEFDRTSQTWTRGEGFNVWSEPVYSFGGNSIGTGSVPLTDALKGAESDALSKAASKLGVGMDAYKGKLQIQGKQVVADVTQAQPTTEPDNKQEIVLLMLKALLISDPDMAQKVIEKDDFIKLVFTTNILADFVNFIKKNNLQEFLRDNLEIVLNKEIKGYTDLSADEVMFLWDMCKDIVADENVTWESALVIAKDWDGTPWKVLKNKLLSGQDD